MDDYELEAMLDDGDGPSDADIKIDVAPKRAVSLGDQKELMLLSYLGANPNLFIRSRAIMKPEWFSKTFAPVAKFMQEYYDRHHAIPSALAVQGRTGVTLELPTDADNAKTMEFVCEEVESFCRDKAINDFLIAEIEQQEKRQNTNRTSEDTAQLVNKAKEIARLNMTSDLGSEVYRDHRKMLKQVELGQGIATGYTFLDTLMNGGVNRPSFNMISAATGDGKSIMLANAAVYHSILHKEDVIYYTMENSEEMTHQRLTAIMSGLDIRGIWEKVDEVTTRLRVMKSQGYGRIFVKRFPIRNTTMSKIEAHYHELMYREKANIGMLAIDYIDVMQPTSEVDRENIAIRDTEIAQEMYEFAHQNRQIVWSASQQTKGSSKETTTSKDNVSGGTHKVNTLDNLIIAKRNEEDAISGMIWFHLKKTRNSGALNSKVPVFWDRVSQKQSCREEDQALLEAENAVFFGRQPQTGRDKISNDPLVKTRVAMGAIVAEAPVFLPTNTLHSHLGGIFPAGVT